MRTSYLPFLIFLVLFILTIPLLSDFGASVVPGWHTSILPPQLTATIIIMICLVLDVVAYRKLAQRIDGINWVIFLIHLLFTLPVLALTRFPEKIWNFQVSTPEDLTRIFNIVSKTTTASYLLFLTGQVIFGIYYFIRMRRKTPIR